MKLHIDKNLNFDNKKAHLASEFCLFCAINLPIEDYFDVFIVSERKPYGIATTAAYLIDEYKC